MALAWGSGFSLIGPPGQQGIAGQNGSTTRFGTGVPDNTLGQDGDAFFAKDTSLLYFRSGGTYDSGTLLRGGMGVTGVNGASFTSGAGAPTSSANNGDLYIDLVAGEIYKYVNGAWADQGYSIKGPQGARGSMTFTGTSAPTSSNPAGAQAGDVYYQTSADGSVVKIYFLQNS